MKLLGIVGWRGMVGSVLLQRMIEENDFDDITAHFFSTSSAGAPGPVINGKSDRLKDANSLSALAEMDIIITCQGGDYTKAIYPALINHGWQGYWIDAASALRMDERACIILDPVNRENIDRAVKAGIKLFVGGNCSITLSLMGLAGLIKADLIEWMSVMTYQSASGAGAKQVREFIAQSAYISQHLSADELTVSGSVLPLVNKAVSYTHLDVYKRQINPAEAKTVRQRIAHLLRAGLQRHQVHACRLFIGVMQVQRRRHHLITQRLNGEDGLNPAGRA